MQKNTTYLQEAKAGLHWLETKIQKDGSLSGFPQDIACYYKAPTLLLQHGRGDLAHLVLDFIKTHFMQSDGDFLSLNDFKSGNPAFGEFWTYTNGWIVQAAQRLGRFDVAYPGWQYLQQYCNSQSGFWKTHSINHEDGTSDVLTAAHMGLLALYMSDKSKAVRAGDYLEKVFTQQPSSSDQFYLRLDGEGKLITDEPIEMAIFEHVDRQQPNQAYFMLGYPIAFLVKLYEATRQSKYLQMAHSYFKWTHACTGNLRNFFFSHKVAWGAHCLSQKTHDDAALNLCHSIAEHLVSIQESDGSWLSQQDALTHCDQTVEIAIWLTEIS